MDSRDLIAHALYLGSAIADTASEPTKVIVNAKPIAEWLAEAGTDDADFDRRLVAIYQQLNNQRGVDCEVHRFVERAQLLYRYLAGMSSAAEAKEIEDSGAGPDVFG